MLIRKCVATYCRSLSFSDYRAAFNIPGVKEHAHFLKDVKDARRIRGRLLECFEQASLPFLSDIDRRNLLNFCIVGQFYSHSTIR